MIIALINGKRVPFPSDSLANLLVQTLLLNMSLLTICSALQCS